MPVADGIKSLIDAYGVDSVSLLELVVGIEEEFGVEFEDEQIAELMSVRGIRRALEAAYSGSSHRSDRLPAPGPPARREADCA